MIDQKQISDGNAVTVLLQELLDRLPKNINHFVDKEYTVLPSDTNSGDFKKLPSHLDVVFDDGTKGVVLIENKNWTQNGSRGSSTSSYYSFNSKTRTADLEYVATITPGIYDKNGLMIGKAHIYVSKFGLSTNCSTRTKAWIESYTDKDFDCKDITSVRDITDIYTSSSGSYMVTMLPNLNMPYVTSCSYMADRATALKTTGTITPRNDGAPIDFSYMFNGCSRLANVGEITTKYGTNFSSMFASCSALTKLEWAIDLSHAENIINMFSNCTALEDGGIHFKNVPHALDFSKIGCDASKYVIDSYKD